MSETPPEYTHFGTSKPDAPDLGPMTEHELASIEAHLRGQGYPIVPWKAVAEPSVQTEAVAALLVARLLSEVRRLSAPKAG